MRVIGIGVTVAVVVDTVGAGCGVVPAFREIIQAIGVFLVDPAVAIVVAVVCAAGVGGGLAVFDSADTSGISGVDIAVAIVVEAIITCKGKPAALNGGTEHALGVQAVGPTVQIIVYIVVAGTRGHPVSKQNAR